MGRANFPSPGTVLPHQSPSSSQVLPVAANSATGSTSLQLKVHLHLQQPNQPQHRNPGWDFQATCRDLSAHLGALKINTSGCSGSRCYFKNCCLLKHQQAPAALLGMGRDKGMHTEEWSGLGGRKGAVGSGQEDLHFLFIAAMKLWAGRLTKSGL